MNDVQYCICTTLFCSDSQLDSSSSNTTDTQTDKHNAAASSSKMQGSIFRELIIRTIESYPIITCYLLFFVVPLLDFVGVLPVLASFFALL